MKKMNKTYYIQLRYACLLVGILWIALPAVAGTVRLYVNYESGTDIDVIDPVTQKVVQTIKGIGGSQCKDHCTYGAALSPDGERVYITSTNERALAVVDQKTGEIIKKVPLTGIPNALAITKDGRLVFVAIRSLPGGLDIVDTTSLEKVKTIPIIDSDMHDIYLTPDGKYVVAGANEGEKMTVVDVEAEQPVWQIKFPSRLNTLAIEANRDGSTRRIFVMRFGLHGFDVVDFAERKVVATIKLPETEASRIYESTDQDKGGVAVCHGTVVSPDNKTFWIDDLPDSAVYVYSLPDLKILGHVPVGARPNWLSFSSDGKRVYVTNTRENTREASLENLGKPIDFSADGKRIYVANPREKPSVSVIDAKTLKEVARIPLPRRPYKVYALELP